MMLAAGTLLVLLGLVGAVYGIYALVRGRRNQGGGGPRAYHRAPSTWWRASGC
jgi:hypothetical protein